MKSATVSQPERARTSSRAKRRNTGRSARRRLSIMGFRRRCHSENGGLKRRDKVAGCPGEFPIPATIYSIAAAAFLPGARAAPPVGESRFGVGARASGRGGDRQEIGRASCRASVCQYVLISVVARSL